MTTPYLVLARKYRPQRFSDLTGQEHVVRTLRERVEDRHGWRTPSSSPVRAGAGKTTSARILARALELRAGSDARTRAASASPASDIAAGTDVDVQEIDAASNNGVDDVRELREARQATRRRAAATRSTSSTRSTCSRRRRSTRC